MKTEKVLLSQVKVNEANPRTITERKLNLLVERLLSFRKMIEIRPVVVDEKMVALGGNMRLRAFDRISRMTLDDIAKVLGKTKNFQRLTKAEQEALLSDWQEWLEKPAVYITKASTLTEAEKSEFIIADNASFGEWDYDRLANEWDSEDLRSWGVDVWQPETTAFGGSQPEGGAEGSDFNPAGLPPELQGTDIAPDDLPKIEGDDETAMERIIIVYPAERAGELAQLIGLKQLEKVVYSINELIPPAEE